MYTARVDDGRLSRDEEGGRGNWRPESTEPTAEWGKMRREFFRDLVIQLLILIKVASDLVNIGLPSGKRRQSRRPCATKFPNFSFRPLHFPPNFWVICLATAFPVSLRHNSLLPPRPRRSFFLLDMASLISLQILPIVSSTVLSLSPYRHLYSIVSSLVRVSGVSDEDGQAMADRQL